VRPQPGYFTLSSEGRRGAACPHAEHGSVKYPG
jgi:hypothetical protein